MKHQWLIPLLFGIFSRTQVNLIGSIGISEAVCFVIAPFLYAKNYSLLKRDGFVATINLSFLVMIGCVVSCVYNHLPMSHFLKGFATAYSLFALIVSIHHMMRRDFNALKWILLGTCISMIINVFAFRQGFEVAGYSGGIVTADTSANIMNGPLFWLQRIGGFMTLPVQGWYLSTPIGYSIIAPLVMTIFTIATSDSGRSAFLFTFLGVLSIIICRKNIQAMRKMQRHVMLLLLLCVIVAAGVKATYIYMGNHQLLNEKAMRKFESQTKSGLDIKALIISGRAEIFAGLMACLDNPIWGYGPWAEDDNDYYGEILRKYGDAEDYKRYAESVVASEAMYGMRPLMPSHSHIVGFWVNYGILGLPFWVYIFYCIMRHLRRNITAIPQWFGYFALTVFSNIWHVISSPYGGRTGDCLFIVCLLIADAVRRGKIELPYHMQKEVLDLQVRTQRNLLK